MRPPKAGAMSYLGGSGGMLHQKNFTNKEQNTAIWGYLGGIDYI